MIQTFNIAFRPSRLLALALTGMAAAALVCAWISLPLTAFLPVAAGIAMAWIWHLVPAVQRGGRAVCALKVAEKDDARWQGRDGVWTEARIQPGSYVSTWLIVINLEAAGRHRRSLVLLPDSASADELRRLRAWLRWRLGRQ